MAKNSKDNVKLTEKTISKKEEKAAALSKNLRENLLRRKQKMKNLKSQEQKDD